MATSLFCKDQKADHSLDEKQWHFYHRKKCNREERLDYKHAIQLLIGDAR